MKRAASADAPAEPEAAAAPPAAAAAAAPSKPGPPAKKQKTPGGGIERFFGITPKQQQQQQQQSGAQGQPVVQQQQQQQGTAQQAETPPSTPRAQRSASPLGLDVTADASAAAAAAGMPSAPGAVHNSGGVLPMLTPPSHDIAADRPTVSNSPVPFRMNSAAAADMREVAAAAVERPPVNRWHAQANCRGMGLQGGDAGSMPGSQQADEPQQQQHDSQPFAGFDQPQQPQDPQQPAAGPSAAAAAAAAALARAAAAPAGTSSRRGGAAGGSSNVLASSSFRPASSVREVPRLPDDGSLPGYAFWKQLVSARRQEEQCVAKLMTYVLGICSCSSCRPP
jgi:hypothetical protein